MNKSTQAGNTPATRHAHILRIDDQRFSLPAENGSLFVLTGDKNSGKTTTLLRWMDEWRAQGSVLLGVYSRAVMHDGEKIGFDLVNVSDGSAYPLIRKTPFRNSWQQGKFYFDTEGFEELNSTIIGRETASPGSPPASSNPSSELIIIDEIGPLEFEHSLGLSRMFVHYYNALTVPMLVTVRAAYLPAFETWLRSLS